MNSIWRDCIKDPPELGKKVLCGRQGDFFVAQRFEEYYFPIPFLDSKYARDLSTPEIWAEIDFPPPFTGYIRVFCVESDELVTMDQYKKSDPDSYYDLVQKIVESMA